MRHSTRAANAGSNMVTETSGQDLGQKAKSPRRRDRLMRSRLIFGHSTQFVQGLDAVTELSPSDTIRDLCYTRADVRTQSRARAPWIVSSRNHSGKPRPVSPGDYWVEYCTAAPLDSCSHIHIAEMPWLVTCLVALLIGHQKL